MSAQLHIPGVNDLSNDKTTSFPLNQWYIAALSSEVDQQPLGRTLLNHPVVMFRDSSGDIYAIEDRCCHRSLPLSSGTVEAKGIRCGYHGMLYNGSGQCIEIPGQAMVPAKARVGAYTVQEKDGFIWMWFGSKGNHAPLVDAPSYPIHGDSRYVWGGDVFHYEAPYQLIHDNLLDLSHVGYVHQKTIGGTPSIHMNADMKTTGDDVSVQVVRYMRDSLPPPTYTSAYPFGGKIDRWAEIDFQPTHIKIWTGGVDAGSADLTDPSRGGFHMRGFHGITPETETTSHYIWSIATNPVSDPQGTLASVVAQTKYTFEEDKVVIEDQYQNMLRFKDKPMISIHVDAGANRARRIMEKLRTFDR
ncbi:aromatic ring-hydroxylating dioxygenase subunit alpha [Aestuariicella hydrocarbonica]|uniref:Aromatic ring-hydroxylating dioxygenase subunit alpha n=1 Tax=Pseudomaricurvus hydrocarbonicus TaxID=1470433 RepID=A0A9E5JS73_9GAMM|nr:aromatic ring-hydroxylating dioxygenase subunit alpha [Aestuariicella hydrocarbonica]NHO65793.1 aromatic ring-hydroxylating dioxygenase subunit alpha [Aestuariicella hydrocarbonica]